MRKYEGVQAQDRNVDTWYDEYDVEMGTYNGTLFLSDGKTINETMMCDTPTKLRNQLALTRSKANIVR